jgi:hypothetical protein
MLLAEFRAGLESAVIHNGHRLALSAASRNLTPTAALNEQWGGIHQLRFIKSAAAELSEDQLHRLAESLHTLADCIFSHDNLQMAVIGEEPALSETVSAASALTFEMKPAPAAAGDISPAPEAPTVSREGWITSSAVSFVAKVVPAVRMHHNRSAALSLLAKILRSRYLHREIREKGGAYGGLSLYNAEDGLFSLVSYRDPHIVRTLEIYERIVDFLASEALTEDDISEAKLQVCSDIDRPDPPGPAARKAFYRKLLGLSDEERRRFKQRVISATEAEVTEAAAQLFGAGAEEGAVAVVSGESQLAAANKKLKARSLALHRI